MRPPAKRKSSRRRAAAKSVGTGAVGTTLAERISTAPQLIDIKVARARVSEWLAGLAASDVRLLKALLASNPTVSVLLEGVAESSPYLWELVSQEPKRLLRLLQTDPDQRLAALLSEFGRHIASSKNEAEAMRSLRHMKSEAALLIALADIGGVWPVMHAARALTNLADTAVDAATRFVLAEATRAGRLVPKDRSHPHIGSGYIVLAMGKMGAFELNYSSDIDLIVMYDPSAPALPENAEPSTLFVRLT